MTQDYSLIEASFLEQYGIRLSETDMSWREFSDLTCCLSSDTPLGRIVAIRSEKDTEVISKFTPQQRNIRDAWNNTHRKELTGQEYEDNMDRLLAMALA